MNAAERQLKLLSIMIERRSEDAQKLADEFKVMKGTILHDVDTLCKRFPISTSFEGYGKFAVYITDDFWGRGSEYFNKKLSDLIWLITDKNDELVKQLWDSLS